MSESGAKTKDFFEGERVTWKLSPYNYGFGRIRGKVEGIAEETPFTQAYATLG